MRLVFAGSVALLLAIGCSDGSNCSGTDCVPKLPECAPGCGAHSTCVSTAEAAECQCVAGYEGDPCAWTGGFADPDLTDPTVWRPASSNEVALLPDASGDGDALGLASFAPSVVCNAGALGQVVQMPPYDLADPFVIEITYRASDVNGVDVYYGRAVKTLPVTHGEWESKRRFCLGEAAYGGPVTFEVLASERFLDCFSAPMGSIDVDRIEILVAEEGECPKPNSVLNGAADLDGGGWSFETDAGGFIVPTKGLEPGVGRDGTSGARLFKAAGSERLSAMWTQVSVPLPSSVPSPALRFWWKAKGWPFQAQLGAYTGVFANFYQLDTLLPSESPDVYTYCLPPWTHGNATDLSFKFLDGFYADEGELVVDDVELISDPRCGDSTDMLDPSFDAAPNRWPGVFQTGVPYHAVDLLQDPVRTHGPGSGVLRMSYPDDDINIVFQTWVWVPGSEGTSGPRLVFYSNLPAEPSVSVKSFIGRRSVGQPVNELVPGGGWLPNVHCLPPQWAERWFRFTVRVGSPIPTETPTEFDTPKEVLIDDLEVMPHVSCPVDTPL